MNKLAACTSLELDSFSNKWCNTKEHIIIEIKQGRKAGVSWTQEYANQAQCRMKFYMA